MSCERGVFVDMKKKEDGPAEYTVCGTKYTVTPVFGEAQQKEGIEDKIKRLILQDKKLKNASP